tara:strand:- start:145 stop:561 length:417 start_codon:yes stop_codon:yes gene_type:complete
MKVERIFKQIPPDDLILKILKAVGIVSFQDAHWWAYSVLSVPTVCQTLDSLIVELEQYYTSHKLHIVKRNMNPRRYVTILRHLIRAKKLDLVGHEVHSSNLPFTTRMMYRMVNPTSSVPVTSGVVIEKDDAIFTVAFN